MAHALPLRRRYEEDILKMDPTPYTALTRSVRRTRRVVAPRVVPCARRAAARPCGLGLRHRAAPAAGLPRCTAAGAKPLSFGNAVLWERVFFFPAAEDGWSVGGRPGSDPDTNTPPDQAFA